MNSMFFGNKKPYNKYSLLSYQQKLLEQHFPFFSCSIINNVLTCIGWLQPKDCLSRYKVKIEYVAGKEPRSTILFPIIEPSVEIHMYRNHSLCLHYREDMKWTEKIKIYEYTVPWISEWITFYELYLINGNRWEGRESPAHHKESDQNENSDME